jgi:phosphoribosylformimino-5-aminoimidazole carboxamide ribotide isomerase
MSLTLYPAIDLKDGKCVRLKRGDMDEATIYADDPGAQAAQWERLGFGWVHVVDLNGAFAGKPVNGDAVRAILSAVKIPVQLGGGIRTLGGVESWLEAGVNRVILGSAAAKDPQFVREAAQKFPGRIVVGIDARGGMVATEGWAETSSLRATDLAGRLQDAGISAIIYTDIARDGMLGGLNLPETIELAATTSVPVIASGGVADLSDIQALKAASHKAQNLEGAIIGRALYDGRLDAVEALAAC